MISIGGQRSRIAMANLRPSIEPGISMSVKGPGFIGEVPVGEPAHPDFRYSANLISFATSRGWYDPAGKEPFNFNHIYGDGKGRWAGVEWIEAEMAARAVRPGKIGIEDIIWAIRTEKLTGDTAGYGQIVPLYQPDYPELRHLWHTQIGAIAAPFVPVFMGMRDVPEEYHQHRYLTAGESSRFLDLRHARNGNSASISRIPQGIESTRSASQVFKRLFNLIAQHHELFLPEITAIWEAAERKLLRAHSGVIEIAETLLCGGKAELAVEYLTYYCHAELLAALNLAETLGQGLEARTRVLFGFSSNPDPKSPEQFW